MTNIVEKFKELGFEIDSTPFFSVTMTRGNAKVFLTPTTGDVQFCEPNKTYYKGKKFSMSKTMKVDELYKYFKEGKENEIPTQEIPF